MSDLKRWYKRNYCILSIEECEKMDLIPAFNLYGDSINIFNCRSFWKDDKERLYRCKALIKKDNNVFYRRSQEQLNKTMR